ARHRTGGDGRRPLIPHPLFQHRRHIRVFSEVALRSRVPAPTAGVNQIWERLRARRALVKIRALATKGIRRHDRLSSKAVLADGALQVDWLKRRHGASPTMLL